MFHDITTFVRLWMIWFFHKPISMTFLPSPLPIRVISTAIIMTGHSLPLHCFTVTPPFFSNHRPIASVSCSCFKLPLCRPYSLNTVFLNCSPVLSSTNTSNLVIHLSMFTSELYSYRIRIVIHIDPARVDVLQHSVTLPEKTQSAAVSD
jgi:hypothetical protein